MLVRALSSTYSVRSALPLHHHQPAGRERRRRRRRLRSRCTRCRTAPSPASDVCTSTAKPRGISQPAAFSASRTSSPSRSPNALCRSPRRSASADTSVTVTRGNGNTRSPARHRLHLALDLLQNRAVHDHQVVGLRPVRTCAPSSGGSRARSSSRFRKTGSLAESAPASPRRPRSPPRPAPPPCRRTLHSPPGPRRRSCARRRRTARSR